MNYQGWSVDLFWVLQTALSPVLFLKHRKKRVFAILNK